MILVYTLVVLFICHYIWSQRKFYVASWQIEGPFAWPFIGNTLIFANLDRIFGLFKRLRKIYKKPLMRLWLGSRLFVYTDDPEMTGAILNNPHCMNKGASYKYLEAVVGKGLITLEYEIWRAHRKLLNPSFQYNIVNSFVQIFNKHTSNLIDQLNQLANGETFDIFKILSLFTLQIVFETTMNATGYETEKYMKYVHSGASITVKQMFQAWYRNPIIFRLSKWYQIQKDNTEYIFSLIRRIHKEKKEEILCNGFNDQSETSNILIDRIVQFEKNETMTEDEVLNEICTVIVAGYETTAVSTAFILLVLAMYPECQQRVFEEIQSVFPEQNSDITMDQLRLLPYLDIVIKEAMRIFPPIPFLTRRATEDVIIGNVKIPAGTEFLVDIYRMHRTAKHFHIDQPDVFNPENFATENLNGRHAYSYIPFSAGSRNCIGMKYVQPILKITTIQIIRNFTITTNLKINDLRFGMYISLKLLNCHLVELQKRKEY